MGEQEIIKFAVVGCGRIGTRHATMIQENPEAELVAIIDTNPLVEEKAKSIDVPFYNSIEEYLQNGPHAHVVTIATPNGLHASQAIQVLDAQRHVVIEKPMALHKKDAEAIIAKSKEVDREVFVVMQNRYSPPSVWLKEVVDSKKLGDIYMVQLNCYWNRDERYYHAGNWHGDKELDGGTLFTQFSHFVDMMYWLFGDITNINARFADYKHQTVTDFEDSGLINFEFTNGGHGSINYSTAVFEQNLESSITIIAENGSIKVSGQYMNEVEYCHIKGYKMPDLPETNPSNNYGTYQGSAANHSYVIQNIADVLKSRQTITTNANEGLMVVDIIERIYLQNPFFNS